MIKLYEYQIPYHMIAKVGKKEDMKLLAPVAEYVPYEPDKVMRRIIPGIIPRL